MQGRDSKGAPQRRLRWLLVLAAAGLVAALVLSACGSSNKSSTTAATSGGATTAAAAAKPTGTPITTYTFADVNTQGPQYKNIEETARVYSRHGSTRTAASPGHPLVENFCDMKGTPTAATACARKAVADQCCRGRRIVQLHRRRDPAGARGGPRRPTSGNCCPVSPKEFTSTDSFPDGQPAAVRGRPRQARGAGRLQTHHGRDHRGRRTFEPLMENAAKALGCEDREVRQPAGDREGLQPAGRGSHRRRNRLPGDDRL